MDSAAAETPPSAPTDADNEPLLLTYIIYAIISIVLGVPVYIGSTARDEQREREHINIAGNAPRVAITFSQKRFQPRGEHFRFEVLWRGACSKAQARAIEQYFMDKHGTRVDPRPTNGITKDIDLMAGVDGKDTARLNVTRACTDDDMLAWAAERVWRDSAIVATTAFEKLRDEQCLQVVALELEAAAELTAFATIGRIRDVYASLAPETSMAISQVQSDLNEVVRVLRPDDGQELRDCVRSQLLWYNSDHRGDAYTVRAAVVASQFATLMTALWPLAATNSTNKTLSDTGPRVITTDDFVSEDEAKDELIRNIARTISDHNESDVAFEVS